MTLCGRINRYTEDYRVFGLSPLSVILRNNGEWQSRGETGCHSPSQKGKIL